MVEFNKDGAMLCPHCRHHNTQQGRVRVQNRAEDAAAKEVDIDADNDKVEMKVIPSKTCDGRRENIYITFACESCLEESTLRIQQHNGGTYFSWNNANSERKVKKAKVDVRELETEVN